MRIRSCIDVLDGHCAQQLVCALYRGGAGDLDGLVDRLIYLSPVASSIFA
jgi:hypothetical protein